MTGKEITDIIFAVSLVGWIPIYVFFSGLSKVILATKVKDDNEFGKNEELEIRV